MGTRLPLRRGSDAARRGRALHVFQVEEVVVGVMRYAVVISESQRQLFGLCAGPAGLRCYRGTVAAVENEIREAIRFHIDGLQADGIIVPQPTSIAEYVET